LIVAAFACGALYFPASAGALTSGFDVHSEVVAENGKPLVVGGKTYTNGNPYTRTTPIQPLTGATKLDITGDGKQDVTVKASPVQTLIDQSKIEFEVILEPGKLIHGSVEIVMDVPVIRVRFEDRQRVGLGIQSKQLPQSFGATLTQKTIENDPATDKDDLFKLTLSQQAKGVTNGYSITAGFFDPGADPQDLSKANRANWLDRGLRFRGATKQAKSVMGLDTRGRKLAFRHTWQESRLNVGFFMFDHKEVKSTTADIVYPPKSFGGTVSVDDPDTPVKEPFEGTYSSAKVAGGTTGGTDAVTVNFLDRGDPANPTAVSARVSDIPGGFSVFSGDGRIEASGRGQELGRVDVDAREGTNESTAFHEITRPESESLVQYFSRYRRCGPQSSPQPAPACPDGSADSVSQARHVIARVVRIKKLHVVEASTTGFLDLGKTPASMTISMDQNTPAVTGEKTVGLIEIKQPPRTLSIKKLQTDPSFRIETQSSHKIPRIHAQFSGFNAAGKPDMYVDTLLKNLPKKVIVCVHGGYDCARKKDVKGRLSNKLPGAAGTPAKDVVPQVVSRGGFSVSAKFDGLDFTQQSVLGTSGTRVGVTYCTADDGLKPNCTWDGKGTYVRVPSLRIGGKALGLTVGAGDYCAADGSGAEGLVAVLLHAPDKIKSPQPIIVSSTGKKDEKDCKFSEPGDGKGKRYQIKIPSGLFANRYMTVLGTKDGQFGLPVSGLKPKWYGRLKCPGDFDLRGKGAESWVDLAGFLPSCGA
jgi:hypothetical protein